MLKFQGDAFRRVGHQNSPSHLGTADRKHLSTIFVELFSKLEHRILQWRTQQLFMDGGDVVFFSLKKAIDDGFDRSMIKACHDAYFFICIDVLGRKLINLIQLYPSVFWKKCLTSRDKEQAMFFYTARRCRFVLFLRGSF